MVGPRWPVLRGGEQGPPVARVEHEMMDDMAQEMRPVGVPVLPRRIAAIDPRALARGDQQTNFAHCRNLLPYLPASQRPAARRGNVGDLTSVVKLFGRFASSGGFLAFFGPLDDFAQALGELDQTVEPRWRRRPTRG